MTKINKAYVVYLKKGYIYTKNKSLKTLRYYTILKTDIFHRVRRIFLLENSLVFLLDRYCLYLLRFKPPFHTSIRMLNSGQFVEPSYWFKPWPDLFLAWFRTMFPTEIFNCKNANTRA